MISTTFLYTIRFHLPKLLAVLVALHAATYAATDANFLAHEYAGLKMPDNGAEATPSTTTKSGSRAWEYYDRSIGAPLRNWAQEQVAPLPGGTIFYPFSGPDFVTVGQIFPEADRYVLAAIQPAGPLVDTTSMKPNAAAAFKYKFQAEWAKFGALGFFRTIDLNANSASSHARLTSTPVMMAFAAALGYRVDAVRPLEFDPEIGDYHAREVTPDANWNSVRIDLSKNGKTVILDYVCIDLSDGFLNSNLAELSWIQKMAKNPTLLKAASHLLTKPYFSSCRAAIVDGAPLLIQDETGLDYGDLKKIGDVKLYGRFAGALKLFNHQQPELIKAYAEAGKNTLPLPFAYSYQKSADRRSLQVARRATP
jgi:hypothetical protein